MRKLAAAILAAVMAFSIAACSGGDEQSTPSSAIESTTPTPAVSSTPTPTATPEPIPTATPEPSNLNPLTGLEMDETKLNRRPVAIMINNIKRALPQYGLASADIIYEVVAEGGITRLVAVMQDPENVDVVGSVRSTRSYYLDLAQGHDAILFHAGASEMAYSDISTRGVNNADGTRGGAGISQLYYRDTWRQKNLGYEHSLMTSGERIAEYLENTSYRTEHEEGYEYPVRFEAGYELDGESAKNVSVKFSSYKTGVFEYDEQGACYLVNEYGEPHIDANTGEQLAMTNVLVLEANIRMISGDAYGRMEVDLVGEGDGLLFCGGKSVKITWSKDSYTSPFTYYAEDGEEQVFRSGTSYICIIADLDNVTVG